jgi:hypothetical protein
MMLYRLEHVDFKKCPSCGDLVGEWRATCDCGHAFFSSQAVAAPHKTRVRRRKVPVIPAMQGRRLPTLIEWSRVQDTRSGSCSSCGLETTGEAKQCQTCGALVGAASDLVEHTILQLEIEAKARTRSATIRAVIWWLTITACTLGAGLATGTFIAIVAYQRRSRGRALVIWLRRFRRAASSRRLRVLLWIGSRALYTPATLQDSSVRTDLSTWVLILTFPVLILAGVVVGAAIPVGVWLGRVFDAILLGYRLGTTAFMVVWLGVFVLFLCRAGIDVGAVE